MLRTLARPLAAASALGLIAISAAGADDKATDQAIRDALGDPAPYRTVVDAFQTAAKAHDPAAVAKLVSYPIDVTIAGRKTTIPGEAAFIASYDQIVTPAIAAAVEDEGYGDLFVNWQGVMLGNGEVWINGVCRDDGCKDPEIKVVTIQAGPADAPATTGSVPAKAGELKDYKDWVIGCDNMRACVAIGMTADDSSLSAYLRIAREGAADAAPSAAIAIYPPDDSDGKLKQPLARLSLDAHKAGGLPAGALPVAGGPDGDGLFRYEFPAGAIADLLAALRSATRITVDLYDGDKKVSTQVISLAGSSAALLQMDDQQKRVGTATALVKPGSAAASTIPPVPALPVVKSLPVTDMGEKLPAPPHGVAKPKPDDCMEGIDPYVAFDLGGGASLWGTCVSSGAYNFAYDFRVIAGGKASPWSATVPGVKPDDPSWLWNAYVDDETKTLGSYFKGRGLGDCGDATEWAWDGQSFAALTYRSMDNCRGVQQGDWPVLYRAQKG